MSNYESINYYGKLNEHVLVVNSPRDENFRLKTNKKFTVYPKPIFEVIWVDRFNDGNSNIADILVDFNEKLRTKDNKEFQSHYLGLACKIQ